MFKSFLTTVCLVAIFSSAYAAPKEDNKEWSSVPIEQTLEYNKKLPDYQKIHDILAKKDSKILWVVTGDSITHGCRHTNNGRSYAEHWAERMRWDNGRKLDMVINTGVSGETTAGFVKDFDWRVARYQPHVVSVNLGMNDCTRVPQPEFKKNLETIVREIRRLKAIPILQVTSPGKTGCKQATALPAYWKIIQEVAQKNNVLLVDHASHWATFDASTSWFNDAIHPNAKGHIEMFKVMAYSLGLFDLKFPTCKQGDKTL